MATLATEKPAAALSLNLDELTSIYEPSCNLAVWLRDENEAINEYASFLASNSSPFQQLQKVATVSSIRQELNKDLPVSSGREAFIADVVQAVDMFACLFDLKHVGFRLTRLDRPMCPKFHVDRVPCRLLLNYCGNSTEWLPNDVLDRSKLGPGSLGMPDRQSGLFSSETMIQSIPSHAVALLKGEAWEGNEGGGLVHRSPAATPENPRLLLSLDFS